MSIHRKNGVEAEIGKRQIAIKKPSSNSWFQRVNKIANYYNLPNTFTIFNEPPWDKISWKNTVKTAIHEHQINAWKHAICYLLSSTVYSTISVKCMIIQVQYKRCSREGVLVLESTYEITWSTIHKIRVRRKQDMIHILRWIF